MKSITILSLSLFEIAITASLSLLFSSASSASPPVSLLFPPFPRLPPYCPFPRLPPCLYPALTFILTYLSSSTSTALVFFIFHSTFILPFLLYFHLSFSFLPACLFAFFSPKFPRSYDNIFPSPSQRSIGFSFFIAAFFLLNTPNLSVSLAFYSSLLLSL